MTGISTGRQPALPADRSPENDASAARRCPSRQQSGVFVSDTALRVNPQIAPKYARFGAHPWHRSNPAQLTARLLGSKWSGIL